MNLKEQVAWLENARASAKIFIYAYRYKDMTDLELEKYANAWLKDFGKPHPLTEKIVKQNHEYLLDRLSEIENERDENWLHEAGTSEAL